MGSEWGDETHERTAKRLQGPWTVKAKQHNSSSQEQRVKTEAVEAVCGWRGDKETFQ